MKKIVLILTCMTLSFVFVACNNEGTLSDNTEKNSETENASATNSETEFNSTEKSTEDSTEFVTATWDMTWDEIVQYSESYSGAQKLDDAFNVPNTDLAKWFEDYNGQEIQRISDPKDSSGPAIRGDIIFYNTEETDVQLILKSMIDVMVKPLMETDENREFVITKYELTEQKVKQINENVWLVRAISGYYSFEGIDGAATMEEALRYEKDIKDGMINFLNQGSESSSQYILIKQGAVYRLQKAGDMGGYGVELE